MATRERRVVVEYEFKGYSAPDDWDALQVTEVKVTHADGAIQPNGHSLAEIRDTLEDGGFTRQEAVELAKTHNGGRYRPTWREVWVKRVEVHVSMSWLSPKAQKAQREAAGRMRGWWPWLQRTSTKAIVQRPRNGSRHQRRAFAEWMKANLPDFRFNSKRDWWEADLVTLATAHEALKPDGVNVSDGVEQYLVASEKKARDEALPVDYARGRSKLFKS